MNPKILDQILSTRENGSPLASTIATDGNGLNYYTKRIECLHDSSQTFKLSRMTSKKENLLLRVEPYIARLPGTRSKNCGVEVLGTHSTKVQVDRSQCAAEPFKTLTLFLTFRYPAKTLFHDPYLFLFAKEIFFFFFLFSPRLLHRLPCQYYFEDL